MIRKSLVFDSKRIFFVPVGAHSAESFSNSTQSFEILMPIDTFWTVREIIKDTDYLVDQGASPNELSDNFKKVFKLLAPFAIFENDRTWLYKKAGIAIE